MRDNRRLRSGYSDLGPVQIPPHPQQVVLTDATTGLQWAVSFVTDPVERITITDALSSIRRLEGATVYGPNEGPAMDLDGEYLLIINNGRIGLLYTPFPVAEIGNDTMQAYARQRRAERLLNIDSSDPVTAHLGYIAP